jgi:3' exoribonuclease, RNase T-like
MTPTMRYFYDCELIENGHTIDLISIGIVSDDDREYHAVNRDAPWGRVARHQRLKDIVGEVVLTDPLVRPRWLIAGQVRDFLLAGDGIPELWTWRAAYSHVALCQLWGAATDLPDGIPAYTGALEQEWDRLGNPALPERPDEVHNALTDARYNRKLARILNGLAVTGG